ncbi:MAG: hypothetical protein M3Y37_07110, partial [Chloroflexota bacterium]|nr:hypothetical protein [Chloroflexota bacterium]
TLEWAIPAPPPAYNFANLPKIGHRDPIWREKYDRHAEGGHGQVGDPQDLSQINRVTGHIHMPNPSFYPALVSLGIFILALGMLFMDPAIQIGLLRLPLLVLLGIVTIVAAIFGWAFEPASDPEPAHHGSDHGAPAGHGH